MAPAALDPTHVLPLFATMASPQKLPTRVVSPPVSNLPASCPTSVSLFAANPIADPALCPTIV